MRSFCTPSKLSTQFIVFGWVCATWVCRSGRGGCGRGRGCVGPRDRLSGSWAFRPRCARV